jgi:hypothetical protein
MKTSIIVLLCLFSSVSLAAAQTAPILVPLPATKLEQFAMRKDALIATESYYVQSLSGDNCNVRFQAIILYEPGRENEQLRGVKIQMTEGQQRVKDAPVAVSYVDFDELNGLSRAIGVMLDMTQKGRSLANPVAKEMSFSTMGGLTLTMVQRDTERQLLVTNTNQPEMVCTMSRQNAVVELKAVIDGVLQAFR